MLVDILTPVEFQRPAHLRDRLLEHVADVDAVKLDDLKDLLKRRLEAAVMPKHVGAVFFDETEWNDQQRDSIDKRSAIALTLFAVAHARKPDGKLLYENGIDRARVVLGWHEFALAAQAFTRSVEAFHERIVRTIREDRQGYELNIRAEHYQAQLASLKKQEADNANNPEKLKSIKEHLAHLEQIKDKVGPSYNPGFTQKQANLIVNIGEMNAALKNRDARLKDLQDQYQRHVVIRKDRQAHLEETVKTLVESRDRTAREVAKVRVLQREFFDALKELKDADETNFRLEQEIRRLEGVKGGRTP
jgi:hypothetical protein